MPKKRKSPNPSHQLTIEEAMETTELRDAQGNVITLNDIEEDPDWIDYITDPTAKPEEKTAATATGETLEERP